jgi:hypothetical protein
VAGADRGVDEVEVAGRVDRDRDARPGCVVGRQRPQRRPVGGRVRDQQVVAEADRVQPDRLGQRIAHNAPVSWLGQGALDQAAAAERLAHHPDGHPAGPSHQVPGVTVERGKVNHGERRVKIGGRPVIPGIPILRVRCRDQVRHSGTLTGQRRQMVNRAAKNLEE